MPVREKQPQDAASRELLLFSRPQTRANRRERRGFLTYHPAIGW